MIKYRENHKKTLEGLVWFAQNAKDHDHYWAMKTLFFADYFHLNKYGRPVFGDTIHAMESGPVPSFALNLINRAAGYITKEELKESIEAFDVVPSKTGLRLAARRQPDMDLFSRTDIECLKEALSFCRDKTFAELYNATHEMPAYKQAWESRGLAGSVPMDFALLIDEGSPSKEELLEHIKATSAIAVF